MDTKPYSLKHRYMKKTFGSLAVTFSAIWQLICNNYSNTAVTKMGSNSVTALVSNSCLILNRVNQKVNKLLIKKKFSTGLTWSKITKVTEFFEYYWFTAEMISP